MSSATSSTSTEPSSLRVIFAGTPDFAASHLQAVLDSRHEVIAVYTQPDRPAGRGKKLVKSPVKLLAESHQLPVYQPINFKDQTDQAQLASLEADLMIVVAYGLLLPKTILDSPKLGCINVHASLLPRWRGAAPIQRAIQAGDNESGVTIMQMDVGLDTGDMLLKKAIAISDTDTGGTLHDRLAEVGQGTLVEALDKLSMGPLSGEKQDDQLANYAHKLNKQEAQINWADSAEDILRTIRAFTPWPVAYTVEKGERIRIFSAQLGESAEETSDSHPPGKILHRDKNGIEVQCGQGRLKLLNIQLPGAKAMSVADFLNGGKPFLLEGSLLESRHV